MPRYQPDMNKASFTFPIFQKGLYTLEIGEPKSFAKMENGAAKNFGVRAPAKVVQSDDYPDMVGKNFQPINFYYHSDGGINYSKGVLAAILGASSDDDFNQRFGSMDWVFNTEDNSVGQGWHDLRGKLVIVECDEPTPNDAGTLQTVVKRFHTVR